MKNSRNERLSDHLLNVDEDLLDNAYDIDDAEKLKQYIKHKNAHNKRPFYLNQTFRKVAAIAACFVIVIGVIVSIPVILMPGNEHSPENNGSYDEVVPPWLKDDDDYLDINSIDMLNYYSAIRVLSEPSVVSLTSAKDRNQIMLLSANVQAHSNLGIMLLSNAENNGEGYDTPPEGYKPGTTTKPQTLVYYELEENAVFTLSQVTFFQIELNDESGFLASKVGTGIVDVVITDNDLENMITFRNGDKYYSCCENGGGPNYREFSTHKYVEGFYLVKNLEQDNYQFTVYFDQFGNATDITCTQYKKGGPNADEDMSVKTETHTTQVSANFTIADLEKYFNSGKLPEGGTDDATSPGSDIPDVAATYYTNGLYILELKSDGTFTYESVDENAASYRKGKYSMFSDAIEFRFIHEGEVVETVTCNLTGPDSFTYNGTEYRKEPSGGEQ